jgi:hypothetical protein
MATKNDGIVKKIVIYIDFISVVEDFFSLLYVLYNISIGHIRQSIMMREYNHGL